MVFFTDAEPTNLCDGIVGGSSFYNIPVDVKRDIVLDEFPDIFTECGSLPILIQCCDVRTSIIARTATRTPVPWRGVWSGMTGCGPTWTLSSRTQIELSRQ